MLVVVAAATVLGQLIGWWHVALLSTEPVP